MKNIYFTYRRHYTNRWTRYNVSYYNDKQFADFKEAWLTEMIDGNNFIPDDRITAETVPGIKTLRRAGVLKYDDSVLDATKLKEDLKTTTQSFLLKIKTAEEMAQWIRDNTDLEEVETNKFKVKEADEETDTEAEYLNIS